MLSYNVGVNRMNTFISTQRNDNSKSKNCFYKWHKELYQVDCDELTNTVWQKNDKLTVWRVGCVTSLLFDELTVWWVGHVTSWLAPSRSIVGIPSRHIVYVNAALWMSGGMSGCGHLKQRYVPSRLSLTSMRQMSTDSNMLQMHWSSTGRT